MTTVVVLVAVFAFAAVGATAIIVRRERGRDVIKVSSRDVLATERERAMQSVALDPHTMPTPRVPRRGPDGRFLPRG